MKKKAAAALAAGITGVILVGAVSLFNPDDQRVESWMTIGYESGSPIHIAFGSASERELAVQETSADSVLVLESEDQNGTGKYSYVLKDGSVRSITADLDFADLTIQKGDRFRLITEGISPLGQEDGSDWISCDLDQEGNLYLQETAEGVFLFSAAPKITLEIPDHSGDLDITASKGNIYTGGIQTEGIVTLTDTAGNIEISKTESSEFHLQTELGNIKADHLKSRILNAETKSGNITIRNTSAREFLSAQTELGNIDAALSDDLNLCSIDMRTSLGELSFNSRKIKNSQVTGGEFSQTADSDDAPVIDLSSSAGNISLSQTK